jgi:hypothetical protein
MLVPNQFQDMDLSRYSFNICYLHDPLLLEDLDSHLLLGYLVDRRFDLAESTLPLGPA